MRFKYDASSRPSAPAIEMTVTNPGIGSCTESALIDTGAAITVIPERLAEKIGLGSDVMVMVAGMFGTDIRYKYIVDVAIGGMGFKSLEVIAAGDEPLVGRNLINLWKMTLDGRNEVLEIHA